MKRTIPLLALLALPAFAENAAPSAASASEAPAAAPAPAAVEAAPAAAESAVAAPAADENAAPERPKVRPGPPPRGREMTPEMKAYVDRLEAIRRARDEQARAAAQAEKDIDARKTALAAEDEKVGELAKTVAELRASLEEAEKALAAAYAADEAIVALEAKKAEAEAARDAKQREMHAAVAAAMDERAARFHGPRPGAPVRIPASAGLPAKDAPAAAPAPAPAPAAE